MHLINKQYRGFALIGLLLFTCFLTAPVWARDSVKTRHGTLTLPTYAWHNDSNPVFQELEGRIYYPYARQDHVSKVKASRDYQAIFMENEYLRITCLPELNGRIHSVFNKAIGQEMFHTMNEIKPALIAMRGAWISGGIEWNTGPHGHTATMLEPANTALVDNADGSVTLHISNTEKLFRNRWRVKLTLHPGKAYLDEQISIYNPTDGMHPYYFWNCTAFPNLENTRFIYPMTLGTDHGGREFYTWPIHEGKDLSWLGNYPTMSSIFSVACPMDFFGAYDTDIDRGIVSYADHKVLPGKKAWTWGKDGFGVSSQMSLSDAGPVHAQYIEVQSGPLPTQSDYGILSQHNEVAWQEYWYPVHGLGNGFEFATLDVTAQAYRSNGGLELRFIPTGSYPNAECVLKQREQVLLRQAVSFDPARPATVTLSPAPDGPILVTIRDRDSGNPLMEYTTPLDIPKEVAPTFTPEIPDEEKTTDQLFLAALKSDKDSNALGARQKYEVLLERDPRHIQALLGLGILNMEQGRFTDAEELFRQATERNAYAGMAWYLLGSTLHQQERYDEALHAAYQAVRIPETTNLAYALAGKIHSCMGEADAATKALGKAHAALSTDERIRDLYLIAWWKSDADDAAFKRTLAKALAKNPLDFVLHALSTLTKQNSTSVFASAMTRAGDKEFIAQEVGTVFTSMGDYATALKLIEAVTVNPESKIIDPSLLNLYYLAYWSHRAGDNAKAAGYIRQVQHMDIGLIWPSRSESLAALQYAVEVNPKDAAARMMIGYLYAGKLQVDKALPYWKMAVKLDASLNTAWRLLGLHAWKKENDLAQAEDYLRKALVAKSNDQIVYNDLVQVLTDQERRAEAIALVASMPPVKQMRYDLAQWLTQAYFDEERLDECIDLLSRIQMSNWEGQTGPHDQFEQALVARGKKNFEAQEFAAALADFDRALTYPENLGIGPKYQLTDAVVRFWQGKTLMAIGREDDAVAAWAVGAAQLHKAAAIKAFVTVSGTQDEYVKRCKTAMEVSQIAKP
jgi:tetratricopeptide (TPR) repeat protein